MAGKDITNLIRERTGIDGTVPQTRMSMASLHGLNDDVIVHIDGETITVGYITHDDDRDDFWENDEGAGTYVPLTRQSDPNAMMKAIRDKGKIAFFVERYSHGLDHYSVAQTRNYPVRQFDVGCVGIITPCEDVQDRYRKLLAEQGEDAARAEVVRDTNEVLQSFSDHCNGNVFGAIIETWKVEDQHVRAMSIESCWGLIGSDYAIEELKSMMLAEYEPAGPGM